MLCRFVHTIPASGTAVTGGEAHPRRRWIRHADGAALRWLAVIDEAAQRCIRLGLKNLCRNVAEVRLAVRHVVTIGAGNT